MSTENENINNDVTNELIRMDNERNNNGGEAEEIKIGDKPNEGEAASPLGKVSVDMDRKRKQDEENMKISDEIGYRQFNLSALPSEGKFYPADCKLRFRACNTDEIKFYSTLIEGDGGVDLQNKIGFILGKCIQLFWGGQQRSAADYLKDADKICMMFAIRDLTMDANGRETKLMDVAQCNDCGKKHKFEITNDKFSYYKFNKGILKYYSEQERCFCITDSEFPEPVRLYVPSVGVNNKIMKFMRDKETNKARDMGDSGYYNVRYLTILSFIVADHMALTDERMENVDHEVTSWTQAKFECVNYAVDQLNLTIKPTVTIKCKKSEGGCGGDVTAPVIFRKGWRHFFNISNIVGKLFSDSE